MIALELLANKTKIKTGRKIITFLFILLFIITNQIFNVKIISHNLFLNLVNYYYVIGQFDFRII